MARIGRLLAAAAMLCLPALAIAREDPPTPFSQTVTAAVPDWRAQDWRRGVIKLHPSKFTWQSDYFLELAPDEAIAGRTMQKALESAWSTAETKDNPVDMAGAKQMGPDILARSYRWEYAFDNNLSLWGIAKTAAGRYLPFHINCDFAHAKDYGGEQCLRSAMQLLVLVQQGKLRMPETPAPLTAAGWDGQYLSTGMSLLVSKSWNGLRRATVYATPPATIPAAGRREAIGRFANSISDEDDKAPGPLTWSGTDRSPWVRRSFPQASDGPAIQMAGSIDLPDGRTVLVGVRCPNQGWIKTCAHGVERALLAVGTGEVERRRTAVIAATLAPPPTNGIKDAEILGLFTEGRNTMGAGGYMTGYSIDSHLYLRDGTAKREFDKPPAYIDRVASRRDEPKEWGRWTRAGDTITVTWNGGDSDTVKVTPTSRMTAGPAGMRLDGRYRHVSGSGTIAFGGGNSTLAENEYRFFPDGTFSSDRSVSFMAGPGPAGGGGVTAVGGSSGPGTRGKYQIEGYTVKLTYPDGRVSRLSFAAYAHELAKGERSGVMLDGTFYFRDSGK